MTLIKRLIISILIGTLVIIIFLLQLLKFKDRDRSLVIMSENRSSDSFSKPENAQILHYSFHESCNCSRPLPNLKSFNNFIDFDNLHYIPDGTYVGKITTFFFYELLLQRV